VKVAALPARVVDEIRRSRRHPRPTQFDYLHLRYIVEHLALALRRLDPPPRAVLDVFCGARPYDDLLPPGAHCVGLDIDDRYGVADVVSKEFLPFPDASFDLVICLQAFHYVEDPERGVAELRRVVRPGGTILVMLTLVWEYDRSILEHRYTGPELAALFAGWEDVEIVENGGRAVCWTTMSGCMLNAAERRVLRLPVPLRLPIRAGFRAAYVLLNVVGLMLDRLERRRRNDPYTLPMNLLLTARRPRDG
jgi:SAM-dependent methyltransferase